MDADRLPSWASTLEAVVLDGYIVELVLSTRGMRVQAEAMEAATKRLGIPVLSTVKAWHQKEFGELKSSSACWRGVDWTGDFEGSISLDMNKGRLSVARIPHGKPKPSVPL
jgi:hypothetical protein